MLEPLGLEYIAAAMPGKNVQIIDLRFGENFEKRIRAFKPDLIGFSGLTIHVNPILKLIKLAKELLPDLAIWVGGHHATVLPQDFDVPGVDIIIMGEGCSSVREIFQSPDNLRVIAGIAYMHNGKRIYNPKRIHPSLDELPLPRRVLTKQYRRRYHYVWNENRALVRTSMGCPFRCTFCSTYNLTQGRYLTRNIDMVVEEIKSVQEKNIFLVDDESMIDYPRMMNLASRLKQCGVKKRYYLMARADSVINHPDLFKAWKDIGLEGIDVGFETYNDEGLLALNKQETKAIIFKALEVAKRLGLKIEPMFMIDPRSTVEDFTSIKKIVIQEKLWRSAFGILTPLPGSQLWEDRKGEIVENNWDLWDCEHSVVPTSLPESEFYKHYQRLSSDLIPLIDKFKILPRYLLNKALNKLQRVTEIF
ncbi:MAG: radical SAM protein [Candidatus Edwardsbacteria bacterium]|nr:radical SAM protein [Candidatus Edwardsbacteria bacterium]